ncbi:hypothetical protein [Pseudomonas citronellolis]|nr:hypothetical protein [Pseudomonas citronellolis]MDF3936679.1 hypothetical protein [Pseudomonas citronellolis]
MTPDFTEILGLGSLGLYFILRGNPFGVSLCLVLAVFLGGIHG